MQVIAHLVACLMWTLPSVLSLRFQVACSIATWRSVACSWFSLPRFGAAGLSEQ